MKRTLACVAVLLGPALAAAQPPDARRDAPLVRVAVGVRSQWYGSAGYDPFSGHDFAPQSSIQVDASVLRFRTLSLAAGLDWDFGSRGDDARGIETRLFTNRLTVPVEGRWHLARSIYAFGRVAPGFVASSASLRNVENDVGSYRDTRFTFATDLSAGAAFALTPLPRYRGGRVLRLWAIPEVGYGFATRSAFQVKPGETRPDSDVRLPGNTLETRLPGFAPSGPFFRISLALAF